MGWFGSSNDVDREDIKRQISDLERDLRDTEYWFNKACDELNNAEKREDSDSARRWDDLAYNYKNKIDDIKSYIRDLEREL